MNAFDISWIIMKKENEECPACGMKKMHCMTQKMGCGGKIKKNMPFSSVDDPYAAERYGSQEAADADRMRMEQEIANYGQPDPDNMEEIALKNMLMDRYAHLGLEGEDFAEELFEEMVRIMRGTGGTMGDVSGGQPPTLSPIPESSAQITRKIPEARGQVAVQ